MLVRKFILIITSAGAKLFTFTISAPALLQIEITSFITNESSKKVSTTVEIISRQEACIPSDCAHEIISDSISTAADGKYSRISGRKLHKTAPSSKEVILQGL
jgi:hypothetical protein